mmetsp:Transcript_2836/g.5721  ORF Transcript_2836/g.5721 Transcript_2836/m.5721 type:complete len:868 (-) Transcript_2836:160-2763(-)|eukprot:CAMPEP_0172439684 /NCGR_PEP_ID=MMETSP1065-20121228/588_1 /TAXON_ID=265537 /ORGANISM="Amphiprora paludosa, Strain CCMP125" /LENGTH=867 /DNA_ID=CAMNT_0013188399 /DNA_START=43 /DNA_END=2646 /DNA_ORIENTATION=-
MATALAHLPADALRSSETNNDEVSNKLAHQIGSNLDETLCWTHGGRTYRMLDVRSGNAQITPKHELLANFVKPSSDHLGSGPSHSIFQANGNMGKVDHSQATRRLPTEILYDKDGLDLFDDITQMESEEYYLTACEENIFQNQMDRLIPFIPDGCAIIELGCGSMAKTAIFLDALRKAGKKGISFYAIDIEQTSLQASIEDLVAFENKNIGSDENRLDYYGVLGSYDQALESNVFTNLDRPKVVLWLGSSIGNWTREGASDFLSTFSDKVMKPHDLFMIGMDKRNDPLTVAKAYNDSAGITKEFGMNGLRHLNKLLGDAVFDVDNFEYFAGYNIEDGRHEAYFQVKKDQTLHIPQEFADYYPSTVELKEGELINYEFSVKYSVEDIHELCGRTRFHLCDLLEDSTNRYSFGVLTKAAFVPVPRNKMGRAMFPELKEFEEVWKLWHLLTSPEIVKDPLEKPITLRHPLLFYMGHIPAFEDIYQSRHFDEPLTEPAYYATIFERGINPVVEDPNKCHAHSEVPDEWPDVSEVRAYDAKVHDRVRSVYEKFITPTDGKVAPGMQRLGRQLSIALEHTIMHAETYIYMLVQLKRELLPKTYLPAYLRSQSYTCEPLKGATWLEMKPKNVRRGIANLESQDDKSKTAIDTEYGWDNETPVRDYEVKGLFQAQSRPITCGEYLNFLVTLEQEQRNEFVPASWVEQEDETYAMLTLFGPIEVDRCLNCPVTISYKLAEKYRDHLRSELNDPSIRIPSEEEWVVMQSQLEKGVVHEDTDFMNWMPAPLKEDVPHTVGSVWEWTSTAFDSYEGYEQSEMYPGYSADFFDSLHNVVRGASFCTHGRVADRLRNTYQRSYPYAFIGVRFVRDSPVGSH